MKTSEVAAQVGDEAPSGVLPVAYKRVDKYTTFTAEYGFKDGDLIVHFFLPREAHEPLETAAFTATPLETQAATDKAWETYERLRLSQELRTQWFDKFPAALEKVATEIFAMAPPSLVAAYTVEVSSWWFKAVAPSSLDLEGLVQLFLKKLDQELDAVAKTTT